MAGNTVESFKKNLLGKDREPADYTARISPIGDFSRVTSINAIINSWNNILVTPVGTYTFDSEYGSNLYKYVFEPLDMATIEAIIDEIKLRLLFYDDRAQLEEISVTPLASGKGFSVDIIVNYKGERADLTLNIDEKTYYSFLQTD